MISVNFVNAATNARESRSVASGTTVYQFLSLFPGMTSDKTRVSVNGVQASPDHVLLDGQTVAVTLANVSGA
jgi:hypothetical protein